MGKTLTRNLGNSWKKKRWPLRWTPSPRTPSLSLRPLINRPLAFFGHSLSEKPFAHLMKGDAFLTFCQFCRKMAERGNSTTFHFINPSQTSEEEEEEEEKPLRYLGRLKSEFQNRRQKKKKKKDIYQPIKSKIGNHICCSCVIPELHSAFVSFPPRPQLQSKFAFLDVFGSRFDQPTSFCSVNKAVGWAEDGGGKGLMRPDRHKTTASLPSLICHTGKLFSRTHSFHRHFNSNYKCNLGLLNDLPTMANGKKINLTRL